MEQVLFSLPLTKLEPVIKSWVKDVLKETQYSQQPDQPDQLLTIDEAAKFLHLTKPTLYSKVSKGELPVMKRSKRLYFSRTELMDYLKAGRKKSHAEIEAEADQYLTKNKRR